MILRIAVFGLILTLGLAWGCRAEKLSPLEQECQTRYQAIIVAVDKGELDARQAEQATSIWVALQHELVERNAEQVRLRSKALRAQSSELGEILDQLVDVTATKERSLAKHLFLLHGFGKEPLATQALSSPSPTGDRLPKFEIRFAPEDLKNTRME